MSNIEHLIENAIISIEHNETYDDWKNKWQQKAMIPEVMSDPWEIWQMAQYVVYTYKNHIVWKLMDKVEAAYGYPMPEDK